MSNPKPVPHTPTPWRHYWNRTASSVYITTDALGDKYPIGSLDRYGDAPEGGVHTKDQQEANAAFIVRACNSHAALVAALEALEPFLNTEAEMLDYASLNDGRASDWGVASMKAQRALKLAREGT